MRYKSQNENIVHKKKLTPTRARVLRADLRVLFLLLKSACSTFLYVFPIIRIWWWNGSAVRNGCIGHCLHQCYCEMLIPHWKLAATANPFQETVIEPCHETCQVPGTVRNSDTSSFGEKCHRFLLIMYMKLSCTLKRVYLFMRMIWTFLGLGKSAGTYIAHVHIIGWFGNF